MSKFRNMLLYFILIFFPTYLNLVIFFFWLAKLSFSLEAKKKKSISRESKESERKSERDSVRERERDLNFFSCWLLVFFLLLLLLLFGHLYFIFLSLTQRLFFYYCCRRCCCCCRVKKCVKLAQLFHDIIESYPLFRGPIDHHYRDSSLAAA